MITNPSYGTNDPRGWMGDPKRGAALGRPDRVGDAGYSGVIHLRRVRIDADGYDGLGTYWGLGDRPLWWFACANNYIDRTVRARTREEARDFIVARYPNAKVRR